MKHVFDATFLQSDKAMIFGKGPSFNPRVKIPEGCVTYCINQTARNIWGISFDMAVFNDLEPLACVVSEILGSGRNAAFPFSIHVDEKPTEGHGETISRFVQISEWEPWMFDLTIHENKGFPDREPIEAVTTYNTALAIALHHGAKTVYTNGIDGGKERHPSFSGTHQVNKPCYDAQFEIEKKMLEKYGAKVVRI